MGIEVLAMFLLGGAAFCAVFLVVLCRESGLQEIGVCGSVLRADADAELMRQAGKSQGAISNSLTFPRPQRPAASIPDVEFPARKRRKA